MVVGFIRDKKVVGVFVRFSCAASRKGFDPFAVDEVDVLGYH
jgi:hypothetical protein